MFHNASLAGYAIRREDICTACLRDEAVAGNGRKGNLYRFVWQLNICPENLS